MCTYIYRSSGEVILLLLAVIVEARASRAHTNEPLRVIVEVRALRARTQTSPSGDRRGARASRAHTNEPLRVIVEVRALRARTQLNPFV